MVHPGEDPVDNNNGFITVDEDTVMYSSESDEEGTLINASCG